MHLTQLLLENFRCFERLEVTLHPEWNVLFGVNGSGKTALLEGLALALGAWFLGFDEHAPRQFKEHDVRAYQDSRQGLASQILMYPARVTALGEVSGEPVSWSRALLGAGGHTTTADASALRALAAQHQSEIKALRDVDLPVLAYYASNRLWTQKRANQAKEERLPSRTQGYVDCLDASSNIKLLEAWMKWREESRLERLAKLSEGSTSPGFLRWYEAQHADPHLRGVKAAIASVLQEQRVEGFRYSIAHKRLEIFKNSGREEWDEEAGQHVPLLDVYPFGMLPDGLRSMVALVADLAWRAVTLNPHHGDEAAARSRGVVLIDEVDLHLHPRWQRQVLASLRDTFPNMQFVVTTHSPQVLASARDEWVQQLTEDQRIVPVGRVSGQNTHRILVEAMGDRERPAEVDAALGEVHAAIELAEQAADQEDHVMLRSRLAAIYEQLQPLEAQLGVDATELVELRYTLHSLEELLS